MSSREFRILVGIGHLGTSIGAWPFGSRRADKGLAQPDRHDWRIGVRLGPNASGSFASFMQTPPLGMLRVGARGILAVPSSPGHVGFPAWMNADACHGYSATGYQPAATALQSCDAQRSTLVRLGGQATRRRGAGWQELVPRAKVGGPSPRGGASRLFPGALWPSRSSRSERLGGV